MKISDCWQRLNGESSQEYLLIINSVQVAAAQPNETDDKNRAYIIYPMDSSFQDLYSQPKVLTFATIDEAKEAAENVFIEWLKRSFQELVYS